MIISNVKSITSVNETYADDGETLLGKAYTVINIGDGISAVNVPPEASIYFLDKTTIEIEI